MCFVLKQEKSDKIRQQREATEEKNVKVKKVLDELRSGVELLFRSIRCDSSVIQDMLGSDNRVTNKNILQYMGIIEQKTMELLQAQQYLQMKVCIMAILIVMYHGVSVIRYGYTS